MAPELKRGITNTLKQESKTYYNKISSDEAEAIIRKWGGYVYRIEFGPQDVVCPSFPDTVSDNTWNCC
jgi:hypothetical protein